MGHEAESDLLARLATLEAIVPRIEEHSKHVPLIRADLAVLKEQILAMREDLKEEISDREAYEEDRRAGSRKWLITVAVLVGGLLTTTFGWFLSGLNQVAGTP